MKEKMLNWFEKHERIYGIGLLFVSLCTVAFGGAYLGATKAIDEHEYVVCFEDDADNLEVEETK